MKTPPLLLAFATFLALTFPSPAVVRAQENKPAPGAPGLQTALFAGGCFWCIEYAFDRLPGVKKTVSGYTGGKVERPSYEDVSAGTTGHAEAVEVTFDPKEVSYAKLLETFWANIDPTTKDRQFADRGTQYRTAIFPRDDEQRRLAEASRVALAQTAEFKGKTIATEITPAGTFYPAEEYHQNYHQTHAERFQAYEEGSGRGPYIRAREKRTQQAVATEAAKR